MENQEGKWNVLLVGGMGIRPSVATRSKLSHLRVERRCYVHDHTGHLAKNCKDAEGTEKAGAALHDQKPPSEAKASLELCIQGDRLLLRNGKTLPFIKSGSMTAVDSAVRNMPVVKGRFGESIVDGMQVPRSR